MKLRLKYLIYFAALLLLNACNPNLQRTIAIEDFFKNPEKTSFKISPDGKYIAFLQPYQNRLNIFVQPVEGGEARRVSSDTDRNISYFFWASNAQILYLKDRNGDENRRLYAVNRDGANVRDLIPDPKVRIQVIGLNRIRDNQVLLALNKRDSSIFDAYRLNIQTGELHMIAQNPGNVTDWVADAEGQLRIAVASDGVNTSILYRGSEKENFKTLFSNNFKTTIKPIGFCKEKDCLYALSNLGRDKMALVEIDCKTGRETRMIYSHPEVDVNDAGYSYATQQVLFAEYTTWKNQRYFLDEGAKRLYGELAERLPQTEIRITDRNVAENKFIIRTYTDRSPGTFYLYESTTKKLTKLADVNPSLKPDELCEVRPVDYEANDGVTIHAYLTLPKGSEGKNLPVMVLPHGGPDARNSWTYNAEVQFLANRGYAVFQMNFRGSTGYGKDFWAAGFKQWGGRIQQDITDGVQWLIKEGIADPKRIGIYGYSFGGYSALWGLCKQPDLYACGVSYSGISNLYSYLKSVPPYYSPYRLMIEEMVGSPINDADYLRNASPIFHIDKIKAPLLIAQGVKDPRVNVNETDQLVKELRKRNVPVTYLVKQNEGHLFRNEENRLDFYRRLEKFLEANLKDN